MPIQFLYFSPTHSSRKIGQTVSQRLAELLDKPLAELPATTPSQRQMPPLLPEDSLVVCAFPVYGGRVPAPFAKFLSNLKSSGSLAIPIAVYGNREIDDSLREAADLLTSCGSKVIAAISAVAQHTLDAGIAAGRPDTRDMEILADFAEQIANKIKSGDSTRPNVPGNFPYRQPATSPAVTPQTGEACNFCGICADLCPVEVIDPLDERLISPGCILCGACVKFCPQCAKSLPEPFLMAVHQMLEKSASTPRQPQLFI